MEEEKELLASAAIDRQLSERFEGGVARSLSKSAVFPAGLGNLPQRKAQSNSERVLHARPLVFNGKNFQAPSVISNSIRCADSQASLDFITVQNPVQHVETGTRIDMAETVQPVPTAMARRSIRTFMGGLHAQGEN